MPIRQDDDRAAMVIQVTSTVAENPLKINSTKMLQNLLKESPLSQQNLQTVLQFVIDGNLPVEHAKELITNGADVNHLYPGMQNLLHLTWKHLKEGSNEAKLMWNVLFESGAKLDSRAQEFYSDVNPQFLDYYKEVTPQQTQRATLEIKPRQLK